MHRYECLEVLGNGTYGAVMKARIKSGDNAGEIVAVKKMKKKFPTWEDCLGLREVQSLSKVKKHPNIVRLRELVHERDAGDLYFVFEYMETNLFQVMEKAHEPLPEDRIRSIMFQLVDAIQHMHRYGFFHRDLKPENLLCTDDQVKLADFGLAREIRSRPPFTEYAGTRWYRAPETLLSGLNYNSPIDIWALGCIMAELYTGGRPLFPGKSALSQLYEIVDVLGPPTITSWPEGVRAAGNASVRLPSSGASRPLESVLSTASPEAISLIRDMLAWDPNRRPTARQLLANPFFKGMTPAVLPSSVTPLRPGAGARGEAAKLADEPNTPVPFPPVVSHSDAGCLSARAPDRTRSFFRDGSYGSSAEGSRPGSMKTEMDSTHSRASDGASAGAVAGPGGGGGEGISWGVPGAEIGTGSGLMSAGSYSGSRGGSGLHGDSGSSVLGGDDFARSVAGATGTQSAGTSPRTASGLTNSSGRGLHRPPQNDQLDSLEIGVPGRTLQTFESSIERDIAHLGLADVLGSEGEAALLSPVSALTPSADEPEDSLVFSHTAAHASLDPAFSGSNVDRLLEEFGDMTESESKT